MVVSLSFYFSCTYDVVYSDRSKMWLINENKITRMMGRHSLPRLLGIFFWPFRGWPSQSSVGPAELGEPNPRTQRPRSAAHTLAVAVVDQAGPPPRRDPRHLHTGTGERAAPCIPRPHFLL
jgi:hypothetical protein